jgi:hypothetical protein
MISEWHVKVLQRCSDAPLHIAKFDYLAIQTKIKKKLKKNSGKIHHASSCVLCVGACVCVVCVCVCVCVCVHIMGFVSWIVK